MDSGEAIAFNALSCGLAVLDEETLKEYQHLLQGGELSNIRETTRQNLERGHFIIPNDLDELTEIRARHSLTRYSNNGFGLTIVPTFSCNFACSYCFEPIKHSLEDVSDRQELSEEFDEPLLRVLRNSLHDRGTVSVSWYGGEPLLALDRIMNLSGKLIAFCDEHKHGYHAGVITNGYLLTREAVRKLMEVRITSLQVTLDGPAADHDQRRPLADGGPTYEKILDNLAALEEPIHVSLRINVDRRNQESALVLLDELQARGLHKKRQIDAYVAMVRSATPFCKDTEHCLYLHDFSRFEVQFYKRAFALGFKVGRYLNSHLPVCGAVAPRSMMILPNGEVHKCWTTIGMSEMAVGRLTADGYKSNRGEEYKWLAYNPIKRECEGCHILPLCMGGCPYLNMYPNLVSGPLNVCESLRDNIEDVMQLVAQSCLAGRTPVMKVKPTAPPEVA